MLNRLRQFYQYFFSTVSVNEYLIVQNILDEFEYEQFCLMAVYEQVHSISVLKSIMENNKKNDFKYVLLQKLALLHDVGKNKNISFFSRMIYALGIKVEILRQHSKIGYEIMKTHNEKLADLILQHHKSNSENKLLEIFQKYDK